MVDVSVNSTRRRSSRACSAASTEDPPKCGGMAYKERLCPETRRGFDDGFREGAVQYVIETGTPIAQCARDLGVNEGTLGNWLAKTRASGDAGELAETERAELTRLRRSNSSGRVAQRLVDGGDQGLGALEVGVRALVVAVVLLVRDDVVPRVLAVAQIGSAAEPRVVVGSVQRRPVVWLEERVARQRAVRDVLEEPGQRIPVGVPSRGVPQLVERPHLRGVVVVDVPALVMVLQLLEDGLVLVETDVDVRFAVRGGGVQEVAVRPGLPGHRAEPPLAHGELAGQGAQHRHVLGGL